MHKPDAAAISLKSFTNHHAIRLLLIGAFIVVVCGSCSSRAGSPQADNSTAAQPVPAETSNEGAASNTNLSPGNASEGTSVVPAGIANDESGLAASPKQHVKHDLVQLRVVYPDDVRLTLQGHDGRFDTSKAWVLPAKINLPAGGRYRFKLDQIPGRDGATLFPIVEIPEKTDATARFFEANAVVFGITEEELDRILSGDSMTKVVYNPDPEFAEQERPLSIEGGINSWTSNFMLEGVLDPIEQADNHGDVLAIIEIGTIDLEVE